MANSGKGGGGKSGGKKSVRKAERNAFGSNRGNAPF